MLALVFNSTAPVLASSWKVNNAQQYSSDDAMMICTGSTFKWISTQAFYDLGQMVFIDPPADAPHHIDNLDCSFEFISDNEKQSINDTNSYTLNLAYQAMATVRAQRPYTAYPYQSAQTRAPPLL
jgi:hypothetical protein